MIDLKLLREDPDAVRAVAAQPRRGPGPRRRPAGRRHRAPGGDLDRRHAARRAEGGQQAGRHGLAADERPALLASAKELADEVKAAEAAQAEAEAAFTAAHMAIPNVVIDGVPAGGEDDFAVLDIVGEPPAHRRTRRTTWNSVRRSA